MTRKDNAVRTFSFQAVGEKIDEINSRESLEEQIVPIPVGIKTPIVLKKNSLFEMHFSVEDQIHDNLKNLIMTNKGERLGNPEFGCDLKRTQFSEAAADKVEIAMMAKIQRAVKKYFPFVNLQDFAVEEIANTERGPAGLISQKLLGVTLTYTVPRLSSTIHGIRLALPMGA